MVERHDLDHDTVRFGCVPATCWGMAEHLLLPSIERGEEDTPADVHNAVTTGRAQLWLGEDEGDIRVAVVTRLRRRPAGRVCEIWHLGGKGHRDWLGFLATIEAAARDAGCVKMELIGREGWARLLPDYRRTAIVMERVL